MEIIRGKKTSFIDLAALAGMLADYNQIHLDLGTGDGRFVAQLARKNPAAFVIGLDACRENLREASRRAPENGLFVIANACALPHELDGRISRVSINFPWGSLIEGLLSDDAALFEGLGRIMRTSSVLEVVLNGGALAEAGWDFEDGLVRVGHVLRANGFPAGQPERLTQADLRAYPSSWARRIAFGRDPRAAVFTAHRLASTGERLEMAVSQTSPDRLAG